MSQTNVNQLDDEAASYVRVGQLVQVYKPTPCCGNVMQLGKQFRVDVLRSGDATCKYCGSVIKGMAAVSDCKTVGFMVSVLRPVSEVK